MFSGSGALGIEVWKAIHTFRSKAPIRLGAHIIQVVIELTATEAKAKAIDLLIGVALQCKDDDPAMIERCLEEMGWEVWVRGGDIMFISRNSQVVI